MSDFDITTLAPADTGFLHLKNPSTEEPILTGDKQAVGITFHMPGSEAYEAAATKQTNRTLIRGKKKAELTADLLRADRVAFLADVTASFDHLGYPPAAGQTGTDLYKALYGDRKYGWVVEQANTFLGDWGNALKNSEKG